MTRYKYNFSKKGTGKAVFVDGTRTAFVKSFGVFEDCDALFLFSRVIDGLLRKQAFDPFEIDEVVAGAVVPQTKNPNVARDAVLSLGLPSHIHGYTTNRACTSSMQTIADAVKTIQYGHNNIILAGGVEMLSDVPIVYSRSARKFLVKLSKARSTAAKLSMIKRFSAKAWLPKPPSLSEPMTGMTMGQHAEIMAKLNNISREDQDKFAFDSHQKAAIAREKGIFTEEITPDWAPPKFEKAVQEDNLIRGDTTLEKLSNLRPVFDKAYGTISAGSSSPITDGASLAMIADEQRVKDLGLKAKSRIVDFCFVGCDPKEQLLIGPAIAIPKLLKQNGLTLDDIDRFEVHEAFAAQVLSCLKSMESAEFNQKYFGENKAYGTIDRSKLNVNGGALAIGHPFGATGARLLTSLSNELIRSDSKLGVIAICAAGGMAGAMLVERI